MTTTSTLSGGQAFGIAKAISSLGERLRETVHGWHRRSRSRYELLMLSERELSDIRLTRCDAASEARKPFWKK